MGRSRADHEAASWVAASPDVQPLGLGDVILDRDACDDRTVTTLSDHPRAEKLAAGLDFTLPRAGAEEHP